MIDHIDGVGETLALTAEIQLDFSLVLIFLHSLRTEGLVQVALTANEESAVARAPRARAFNNMARDKVAAESESRGETRSLRIEDNGYALYECQTV